MAQKWNNPDWKVVLGDDSLIHPGAVIYLAGPMKGVADYNRPDFYSAERFLQQEGVIVLNPAKLPIGMPESAYLPICIAMLEQAETAVFLPGWGSSEGAVTEYSYAISQKKGCLFIGKNN